MESTYRNHRARFSDFEVDLRSRELRKHGIRLKLQDQPFQVLALLLERSDELVTREELRQQLWAADTFVDFDTGLNSAIKKLRDVLGDSAEDPRYIETLPRRGYRFIGRVENGGADSTARGTEDPNAIGAVKGGAGQLRSPVPDAEEKGLASVTSAEEEKKQLGTERSRGAGARIGRRAGLIGASAACLFSALAYWVWHRPSAPAPSSSRRAILAVLPFDNLSHDAEQEFFSDGLTEEMAVQLGKLNPERLTVVAGSSVARYKGKSVAANEIGKELNADYLLEGSVRRVADHVRITVQLIEARDQTDVWAESYDRDLKDILALQDSISRSVASQIHVALAGNKQAGEAEKSQLDPAAHEAYLKGRFYWNKRTAEAMQKALVYFEMATQTDSAYGAAYSGLADCSSGLAWHGFNTPREALPRARAAALKAIEIDPESSEGHASLGLVLYHGFDWAGAEREFKRAVELDPGYANAHHWYGDYLSARGRHDEALLEAKQALQLDPLNLMIATWVGLRYYQAREYDQAIEQGKSTVDLDANFAAAHLVLGESYVQKGQHAQGLDELQRAASLSGGSPLYVAQLGVAYAAAGRRTEAFRVLGQLRRISRQHYVSPYGVAQIYAALNEKEQTLKWLQTAYDDHAVWMSYLAVDPVFDPFRADPRFQDLMRRLALLP